MVPTIQSWSDAEEYLKGLQATIVADIKPLLDTAGFAPFAITREVLSYVDHLGHLYSGKGGVHARSKDYMASVLASTDPNYGRRATEVYQMYRCGPVHEFEPKTLENRKGQLLYWLCYRGERTDSIAFEGKEVTVTHLEPVNLKGTSEYWLPVSTKCLIEDLIASIDSFLVAKPEDERVTAWNRAARDLHYPHPFDFTV